MAFKKCILTGVDLVPGVDSKAHLIPSSLGGSLKPLGILSQTANETLNDKVDFPLIRALSPIMALIGGVPDRSEVQPTKMYTKDGKEMRVVFGKAIQLSAPEFAVIDTPEGKSYTIAARTMKEARTLLGRVKKDNPNFDIDAALAKAVVTESFIEGQLHAKLQFGPISVFPAVFAMAAVYATECGIAPHPQFVPYIDGFEPPDLSILGNSTPPHNAPLPPDTFYWMPSPSPLPQPGGETVTHMVVLVADPVRKEALVYVELFNLTCVAVRFPYAGDALVTRSYGINVLTGEEFPVQINASAICALPWAATHMLGEPVLYKDTETRMGRLIGMSQARGEKLETLRLIEKAIGRPMDGALLTEEEVAIILKTIAGRMVAQLISVAPKPK